MEDLREAALGYYNNGPPNLRQLADSFFQSLDLNRDGQVSINEFIYFLQQSGYHWIHPNFFVELDRNRDGNLDFYEVLTLFYIIKTRSVWCNGCGVLLKGLYFTCVPCFDDTTSNSTYDLCATCYRQHRFSHHHNFFLDNYMLLRCKKGPGVTNVNLAFTPPPVHSYNNVPAEMGPVCIYNNAHAEPQRSNWSAALDALDTGLIIATLAGVSCSIM